MRLIIFFDLPVDNKASRKAYSKFRTYLIKQGYLMMQYSIYSKIFNNVEACENHMKILAKNIPTEGSIRAMIITEKQYSKIKILLGAKSLLEQQSNVDPIINL